MTFPEFEAQWRDDADHIVAHTSGSTGTPKAIRLLKSDMAVSARRTNRFFDIGTDSVLACPLSPDYIAGKMMAVRAIVSGARLLPIAPANDFALDTRADLVAIVPSQTDALIAASLAGNVKAAIIGGAPLDHARRRRLIDAGVNAYETYGMTETASHVALRHITHDTFRALPGITFTTDHRTCLVIHAPDMSFGTLTTNDIVELDAAGDTFRWIGRADNVINSSGIKIHIEQLEAELAPLLSGRQYYISRAADAKWGEVPVLNIVAPADTPIQPIRDLLAAAIDHRRMPREIRLIDAIPLTANGKIRR